MNKLSIIYIAFSLCMMHDLKAQTISPKVISSGGGSVSNNGVNISYTIGETAVNTLQNGNIILTQGQQQPYFLHLLNVKAIIEGYYTGGGQMIAALYQSDPLSYPSNYCDTLTVEIHASVSPYDIITSQQTIIHTDGSATCSFPNGLSGLYHIALKHRNSIITWSKNPVVFSDDNLIFDFTAP